MPVTTQKFEEHLNETLTRLENWKRCEWCGCGDDQRRIGPRSKLCDRCKEWRRKEQLAKAWTKKNPDRRDEEGCYYEYRIQFAAELRNGGGIRPWQGPITPLQLEWALEDLTGRLFGKHKPIATTFEFAQFSDAQRRLLMNMFDRMTMAWLEHRRRGYAIDRVLKKLFPITPPSH